jgi:hypothetical protein
MRRIAVVTHGLAQPIPEGGIMTENEYIIVSNRVKISIAKQAIGDILPGDECGISHKKRTDLIKTITNLEEKMFKIIEGLVEIDP